MRVVLVRNLVSTGIIFAVTPGGSDKTSVGDAPISHQRLQTEKREWEPSDWLTFFVWVQEWSVQWKRKSRDTGSVHRRTDPVPLVCPQKLNSDQPIWSGVYPISTIRRPVSLLTAVVFFSPLLSDKWSPNIAGSPGLWTTRQLDLGTLMRGSAKDTRLFFGAHCGRWKV